MKTISLYLFLLFPTLVFSAISAQAVGYPHYLQNGYECASCHNVHGTQPKLIWEQAPQQNIDHSVFNQLCWSCHNDVDAPAVLTHSSQQSSNAYGNWTVDCVVCHDPHLHRQSLDYADHFITQGVVGAVTATTLTKVGPADWTPDAYQGMILFPDTGSLYYSYRIVGNTADTLTVDPDVSTPGVDGSMDLSRVVVGGDFAIGYGKLIRSKIDLGRIAEYASTDPPLPTPDHPKSGLKEVRFIGPTGTNSFADGDGFYDGICEVCHTRTAYHRNSGEGDHGHGPQGGDCITCHNHSNGFMHGGGGGSDCASCHGHDLGYEYTPGQFSQGAGTVQSHSTHTENDSDDLKGPYIGCGDCHDTASYPYFKSGTDSNSDGLYSLAETDVCDSCHSPAGSYNGVTQTGGSIGAKDNWRNGAYSGASLTAGKEKWCAGCHDETPAYSKGQHVEIIIDNTDTQFSTGGTGWSTGTSSQQYGINLRYHVAGTGTNTATWTPDIPEAGEYSVYAWWTDYSNRATNAPYTINHSGGSETVRLSQKIMGGTWNYLGTYLFTAGAVGSIVLSDDADGLVVADAIKIESGGQATYAPNIIGDNATYGFYATGHKINCLYCHDSVSRHIDGEHRTYQVDEASNPDVVVNPYCNSYRLRYIDGVSSMIVPRTGTPALQNWKDFALCFDCHNRFEVIGDTSSDVSGTNFWNDDTNDINSHWYHLGMNNIVDSDFDNTVDSGDTCIACHNVHGSVRGPMIRHGELISPPGTTRYVPSFNFYYYLPGDGSATATYTPSLAASTYKIYAWWSEHPNRATNAKYLIDHEGGQAEVIVNQEQNGGQWNLLGTYAISAGKGEVTLTSEGANQYIMADAIGWDSDGVLTDDWNCDGINDPQIIIDDQDAAYTGTWTNSTDERYRATYRTDSGATGDSASWTPDLPANDTYFVYAWWHAGTDRATDAPYAITYDGGSDTVHANQREDGGTWNLLGTYPFAAGTSGSVQLNDTATGRIVADVVGWDRDGVFADDWDCDGINDPEIILDDTGVAFSGSWTLYTTEQYAESTTYYFAPVKDPDATVYESVGGIMQSGGLNSSHVCNT